MRLRECLEITYCGAPSGSLHADGDLFDNQLITTRLVRGLMVLSVEFTSRLIRTIESLLIKVNRGLLF